MRIDTTNPVRTQSQTFIIACVCLMAMTSLQCRRDEDRAYARGSTVIILYEGDERAVGWHGRFVMFLPLVSYNENLEL